MTTNPIEAVAAIVREELRATGGLTPGARALAQGPILFMAGEDARRQIAAGETVLADAPDDVRQQAADMLRDDRISITVVRGRSSMHEGMSDDRD